MMETGARTGAISTSMLLDLGVNLALLVILKDEYCSNETNKIVCKKN